MPPHILAVGAAEPDGACAGTEEEGAGSGPELTTPLGVSAGIALELALGVGGPLATGVAVGA
jgi:hypothetical protein